MPNVQVVIDNTAIAKLNYQETGTMSNDTYNSSNAATQGKKESWRSVHNKKKLTVTRVKYNKDS